MEEKEAINTLVELAKEYSDKRVVKAVLQLTLPNLTDALYTLIDKNDFDNINLNLEKALKSDQIILDEICNINEILTQLSKSKAIPIIAIGGANAEIILENLEDDLVIGSKHSAKYEEYVGGSGLNFSAWLLAANKPVVPVLIAGNDQNGKTIRKFLIKWSQNKDYNSIIEPFIKAKSLLYDGIRTQVSAIILYKNNRTIFKQRLEGEEHIPFHIKNNYFALIESFHTIGATLIGHIESDSIHSQFNIKREKAKPQLTIDLIRKANDNGSLVYAVLGKSQYEYGCDFWKDYLEYIDVLQLNIQEAKQFFARSACSTNLKDMLNWFIDRKTAVVLTMDQFGAIGFFEKKFFHVWPILESSSVKDPTGAGDAFAAGMVSVLSGNRDFDQFEFGQAMITGNIFAACACQTIGGTGEDPKKILDEFKAIHLEKYRNNYLETGPLEHDKKIVRFIDLAYPDLLNYDHTSSGSRQLDLYKEPNSKNLKRSD